MGEHLILDIDGISTPVTKPPRAWWRRTRPAGTTADDPVVPMDATTRQWLHDLRTLDSMMDLTASVTQRPARSAVRNALRDAAQQVVPDGITVRVAHNHQHPR